MTTTPKQLKALKWVKEHGTIPPVEPRTWKSLITRGLVIYQDGRMHVTPDGDSALG